MKNYNKIEKYEYGTFYFLNSKLHRIDGPASELVDGDKAWFQNDKLHRIGGPAIEHTNGNKFWYQNGLCHRIDGPAYEFVNGYKLWFYEGKNIKCNSQDEFERYVKLKLFW
jgi:hypothetical protein